MLPIHRRWPSCDEPLERMEAFSTVSTADCIGPPEDAGVARHVTNKTPCAVTVNQSPMKRRHCYHDNTRHVVFSYNNRTTWWLLFHLHNIDYKAASGLFFYPFIATLLLETGRFLFFFFMKTTTHSVNWRCCCSRKLISTFWPVRIQNTTGLWDNHVHTGTPCVYTVASAFLIFVSSGYRWI